jgi:aspartate aminotransferase
VQLPRPTETGLPLSDWARAQVEAGGWVRRMFAEGQRLRAEHGEDAVADLALGQPLGEPPRAVLAALEAAAAERFPRRHGYMPNLGYPEVREAVATDVDHAGMRGDHIALTGGAAAAVTLALRAVVDPGDEVVGLQPYFGEYPAYCAAAQARFIAVAAGPGAGLDLEALAAALSARTAAVLLNSPCNPTGHVTTTTEMRGLASLLKEHGRRSGRRPLLVVDEVYRNLLYDATRVEPFDHYDVAMLARSFSKDLGLAGERIGYLAVHPAIATAQLLSALELCQRALGFVNAPATMQRLLLRILPGPPVDVDAHRARRDQALALARAAGLQPLACEGGLYLWAPSPWRDGLAYAQALARRRVLVAPGIAFGAPAWLRVCFSAPVPVLEWALAQAGELARAEELTA